MNKLILNENKILKLNNVLKNKLLINNEDLNFNTQVEQMQSYIKMEGARQIGPLIQYLHPFMNDFGEIDMEITIMLQCNNFICNIENSYSVESLIRIPNCMYCRYVGPEEKIKFAYDKINLTAFEKNIPLKGDSYTIFVERDEMENVIVADVFMQRLDGDS